MFAPRNHQKLPSTAPQQPVVAFSECPAKTYHTETGLKIPGQSVLNHCHIVGEIAKELILRYPPALQDALFPPHAAFTAACHDIGKVSPYFFEKIRRACDAGHNHLPKLSAAINIELEKTWGGHAGVSQITANGLNAPQWVPEILGQHHGFTPPLAGKRADAELFGGSAWQKERSALVEALKQRLGMDWPLIHSTAQARLVAGLTSVADWIGSGQPFEDPNFNWQGTISQAVNNAGFIQPIYKKQCNFTEIFGFSPRTVQQDFINVVKSPGIYILEAPMGQGKTEAALFAAYQMLSSGQAHGIYFALPTQLTSNKIYQRFNYFLTQILEENKTQHYRSLLLHGKSWLQSSEMGEEGQPGGAWFESSKRGLLAPFAVGTMDQALMAVMNVKHSFVRAFGLAGKVVILDEVHTYDAYTGTLMDALVELLYSLRCTVIILSATLTQHRRQILVQSENNQLNNQSYPLITALYPLSLQKSENKIIELPVTPPKDIQVEILLLNNDKKAVQEALIRASQGQQILWIENTVNEAQERYLDLAAYARAQGVDCGLLHSRFTANDRQKIENHWVDLFGKPGWKLRNIQGRILVGTQVLEQSLDIDADFLISRFAPTDMLLQRLGRLWRHSDAPRTKNALRQAWILSPELPNAIESPMTAFGRSAWVYSPYVLCRSLEVWQSLQHISLPIDIRHLIENSYAIRSEQGLMACWLQELDYGSKKGHHQSTGRIALRQLARLGLAQEGKTLPESQAQTRYSETENYEVLLLRNLHYDREHKYTILTLLDGRILHLPTQRHSLNKGDWKALTIDLMQQLVPVRAADAPCACSREQLEKLGFQHCFYLGSRERDDETSLLRLALVNEASQIHGLYGASVHERHHLQYCNNLGYRVIKN